MLQTAGFTYDIKSAARHSIDLAGNMNAEAEYTITDRAVRISVRTAAMALLSLSQSNASLDTYSELTTTGLADGVADLTRFTDESTQTMLSSASGLLYRLATASLSVCAEPYRCNVDDAGAMTALVHAIGSVVAGVEAQVDDALAATLTPPPPSPPPPPPEPSSGEVTSGEPAPPPSSPSYDANELNNLLLAQLVSSTHVYSQAIASTWPLREPRSFGVASPTGGATSPTTLALRVERTVLGGCSTTTTRAFSTADGAGVEVPESGLCAVNGAQSGPKGTDAIQAMALARSVGVPYDPVVLDFLNRTTDVSLASFEQNPHAAATPGYNNNTATRVLSLSTAFPGIIPSPPPPPPPASPDPPMISGRRLSEAILGASSAGGNPSPPAYDDSSAYEAI
eukprot:3755683-Prymnesium_polylepis.1